MHTIHFGLLEWSSKSNKFAVGKLGIGKRLLILNESKTPFHDYRNDPDAFHAGQSYFELARGHRIGLVVLNDSIFEQIP
jgi:hypothetical protein